MSDVPRSLQSWVSTIQSVVLTADVFITFYKTPSGFSLCFGKKKTPFFLESHFLPFFFLTVLLSMGFSRWFSVRGFFYRFWRRANIRPRARHGRAHATVPWHMSPPAPWEDSRFCSVSSARNPTPASVKKSRYSLDQRVSHYSKTIGRKTKESLLIVRFHALLVRIIITVILIIRRNYIRYSSCR